MAGRSDYANPQFLVSTDWLAGHLGDANLRVVDCDVRDAYRRAHIPAAVNPIEHYMKGPNSRLIMGPEQFAKELSELGIGDDTLAVCYDASGSLYAARFWWCLRYYGHDRCAVVNGGFNKWLAEGRSVDYKVSPKGSTTFTAKPPREDVVCLAEGLKQRIGRPGVVVWDVRSAAEWAGANSRGNQRVGHVPGAVHREWSDSMTAGEFQSFRPAAELRGMLDGLGISNDKEVVTYCQGGIRAAHSNFVLTLMGHPNARDYDGSMGEWANRDDTPLTLDQ